MSSHATKTRHLYSMRRQLFTVSIALLGTTLALTAYFMIANAKGSLTTATITTVLSQGRNIAIASDQSFRALDPEYELIPLVKHMLEGNESMTSIVITDAAGIIVADQELQNVSEPIAIDWTPYEPLVTELDDLELLYEDEDTYLLKTPVGPNSNTVGYVYMTYSKDELKAAAVKAEFIIVISTFAALIGGFIFAVFLYGRISEPMDALIERVEQLSQASSESDSEEEQVKLGGVTSSFEAMPPMDLLQALSVSEHSYRISLTSGTGEKAHVFLNEGKLVYADCGELAGAEAIYRILEWGEDGEYTVEPEEEFPEANIHESIEGILMEGCRRLDEGAVV